MTYSCNTIIIVLQHSFLHFVKKNQQKSPLQLRFHTTTIPSLIINEDNFVGKCFTLGVIRKLRGLSAETES